MCKVGELWVHEMAGPRSRQRGQGMLEYAVLLGLAIVLVVSVALAFWPSVAGAFR